MDETKLGGLGLCQVDRGDLSVQLSPFTCNANHFSIQRLI